MVDELMTMEHWWNNLHGKTDVQKMLPPPPPPFKWVTFLRSPTNCKIMMHKVQTLWEKWV
jgi:hypothetical protein